MKREPRVKKAEVPSGGYAVRAQRVLPTASLELFPTPPWATRALIEFVLKGTFGMTGFHYINRWTAWEPCAGLRHMSDVLAEYFGRVYATDVFDYGGLDGIGSFVGDGGLGLDNIATPDGGVDWTITNPPFSLAAAMVRRAMAVSRVGVAMLLRTQWIESEKREQLFAEYPMAVFAPFSGRVSMVEGRWDPRISSATSYAWFVWYKAWSRDRRPALTLIPYKAQGQLTRDNDVERFAGRSIQVRSGEQLFV